MRISNNSQIQDSQIFQPRQIFSILNNMSEKIQGKNKLQKAQRRLQQQFLKGRSKIYELENIETIKSLKKKKQPFLKKIVQQQKIKNMVKNFSNKMNRNNPHSTPVHFQPLQTDQITWWNRDGFQLPDWADNLWSLLSIVQIIILVFVSSLSLIFNEIADTQLIISFQILSFIFIGLDMIGNFITIKFADGKKLINLKQIMENYITNKFVVDMICLAILLFDLLVYNNEIIHFMRLLWLLKIGDALNKFDKLQNTMIGNFYQQQYWRLIKVCLLNFVFAHFLAILLISIANINPQKNWLTQHQFDRIPWYQQYVWGYYWGTTIMLTVGFGDIKATNWQQALCLVLIMTVSCITLAYNISCVGELMGNIRSQNIQKNRNYRLFNKLSKKNKIPDHLSGKINNFIEQSSNIKKKFNFQEENQFIYKLPQELKAEFLKESNKKIFDKLSFFCNLTESSLLSLAEKIQMKVSHPGQVVKKIDDDYNILILQQGHITLCCKSRDSLLNDAPIDQLKLNSKQAPYLLTLDFLKKQRSKYQIKSFQYSFLYYLSESITINILQNVDLDYQYYCFLRDKSKHIIDQYEVFKCNLCPGNHTKFTCPKLHFIPIEQNVINKYQHKLKQESLKRFKCNRKPSSYPSLRKYNSKINQQIVNNKILKINKQNLFQLGQSATEIQIQLFKKLTKSLQETIAIYQDGLKCFQQEILQTLGPQNKYPFWTIELDEMKNYKYYNALNNPNNLEKNYPGH